MKKCIEVRLVPRVIAAGLAVAAALGAAAAFAASDTGPGFPRTMTFRQITPANASYMTDFDLIVSDMHTQTRLFSDEAFAAAHPQIPVFIQINYERLGLNGTWAFCPPQLLESLGLLDEDVIRSSSMLHILAHDVYPLMDYPGFYTYDAGVETRETIPANRRRATVKVGNTAAFAPMNHHGIVRELTGRGAAPPFHKNVVIYRRLPDGTPDWAGAEFARILGVDEEAGALHLERYRARGHGKAFPAGAVVAANSFLSYAYTPLHNADLTAASSETKVLQACAANLTRFCPRDPRTGLNAAETYAKHFIRVLRENYPHCDGYVMDVSVSTYYPTDRMSRRVDCDQDGVVDNYQFDGINYYPLAMYDVFHLLRYGKPGVFEGLGDGVCFVTDSNQKSDQRFFDLLNGGEYEHAMVGPHSYRYFMFSGNLDRLLLWGESPRRPRFSFIHNKYADHAHHGPGDLSYLDRAPMGLAAFRLDMASACMASAYIGKGIGGRSAHGSPASLDRYPGAKEQRRKYGAALPLQYDEYHKGEARTRHWLGQPVEPPRRLTDLPGETLWRFDAAAPAPNVISTAPAWAGSAKRGVDKETVAFRVDKVGLFYNRNDHFRLTGEFDLGPTPLEGGEEYTLHFRGRGSNAFRSVGPRYANIPRAITLRLVVNGRIGERRDIANMGYVQEALLFENEREVWLTLRAPESGPGKLQVCLSEDKGDIVLRDIDLRKGCADVMTREFEGGLAVLNGSYLRPAEIPLARLYPGRSFRRLKGAQDPIHNNGQPVGETFVLSPLDGALLCRDE